MRAGSLNSMELKQASDRLGETILDPGMWPDVMEALCLATGSMGAALLQGDSRTPDVPRTKSVDRLFESYFAEGWHQHDLRALRGVPLLLGGRKVITEEDIVTPDEIRRLPFYRDLISRNGCTWFAAVGFWAGTSLWGLCFQRSPQEGLLDARGKLALSQLSLRLTQCATLSTAVGHVALTSALNAIGMLRYAALAIDRCGNVLDSNVAAQNLLGDDMRVHNGRLVVTDSSSNAELTRLFERLRSSADTEAVLAAPIIVRRRRRPSIILSLLPVEAAARGPFLGARAILILRETGSSSITSADNLRKLFGLTVAEARLACRMASGESVDEIASELGRSRETVRNQLKAVFFKTGTHRQGELVALLGRL